ncbi:allophanate hydrolase [Poseidonocella sp. HB161398]|uniref:allophanate hydrolase n=1 Tax=Poseidonocella sp. HB161398 TaxID=2320855 RepID=UPI00110950E6|nr:allophanate hydrolase [Poseidonocella sp. HB161398]
MLSSLPFTLPALRTAYAAGARPAEIVEEVFARLEAAADPGIFLHADRAAALAGARALGAPLGRPLWGMPFAVKDNIDVAGQPTTAACPASAHVATEDAAVVARLRAAGAIVIGKTNLDQFATGLVGTRTPYPVPRNALDPAIVPGGSSSGSALAVARGIVPFALGTDTAGSGRVPAAHNGIAGLKPSLGAWSTRGLVPACRTLDTLSVFAQSTADAWEIHCAAAGYDPADSFSRRFPVPPAEPGALRPGLCIALPDADSLAAHCEPRQIRMLEETAGRLRALGARIVRIGFGPFHEVARLPYERSWVAERAAAIGDRLAEAPETLLPVIRRIAGGAAQFSAVDAFRDRYRLAELRRACETAMAGCDLICVPSIPAFVTLAEDAADPVGPNARLGSYTNFVNLLDLCGIAVPVGPRGDGRPGGVTLLAPAGRDALAASAAAAIEAGPLGATGWPRPAAAALRAAE